MIQLVNSEVNAEVNSGNRKALLASNYAKRICGPHAGMKCDLKGIKQCRVVFGWPRTRNINSI